MATFPNTRAANRQQAATIYSDALLTRKATVLDLSGKVLPGSQVDVGSDGQWPLFQVAGVSVVYYRDNQGQTVAMLATVPTLTPPTVTGSKTGGAALVSVLAVGVALGLWTDGTTA